MASTILAHPVHTDYHEKHSRVSVLSRFGSWTRSQQESRLLWLGVSLIGHGCILTPITILTIVLAGTNLALFMVALICMSMVLVTNLVALPTKITIPIFLFSISVDLGIIIGCAVAGFDSSIAF